MLLNLNMGIAWKSQKNSCMTESWIKYVLLHNWNRITPIFDDCAKMKSLFIFIFPELNVHVGPLAAATP